MRIIQGLGEYGGFPELGYNKDNSILESILGSPIWETTTSSQQVENQLEDELSRGV